MRSPALAGDLDDHEIEFRRIWEGSPGGGLILSAAHVANNEAIAAVIARRGFPLSVTADDTSFPELYELLRKQRKSWGVTLVAWRNLRVIYGVLKRGEMLGLLIDWGYRSDGIPVRLFDAWTTLPAGPATLAAKTGARILPIGTRRQPDGTFGVWWGEPIDVGSADPAELQRATQAMADAMADFDPGGTRAVVQLQTGLAGERGRGRGPRASRACDAGRVPGSGTRARTAA